jgi:hypothetical protein
MIRRERDGKIQMGSDPRPPRLSGPPNGPPNDPPADPSLPLLTERVTAALTRFAAASPTTPATPATAGGATASTTAPATSAHVALHDGVVQALTAHLASKYAAILGEQLQPAIDAAAAQLARRTVESMHVTLTERIDRAVTEYMRAQGD